MRRLRAGKSSKRERERDEDSVGADASGAQKSRESGQESTSEVGSRRGTRHDVHMSPEPIASRLCAEFAAAGLPPTQNACANPCTTTALVAVARFQGKNFAVYFQRVRAILRRHKVARKAASLTASACDKCLRRQ
jgi:hypothetical protein